MPLPSDRWTQPYYYGTFDLGGATPFRPNGLVLLSGGGAGASDFRHSHGGINVQDEWSSLNVCKPQMDRTPRR